MYANQMIFRVFQTASTQEIALPNADAPSMLYVQDGAVTIDGMALEAGNGTFLAAGTAGTVTGTGRFCLWSLGEVPQETPEHCVLQDHAGLDLAPGTYAFRLDSVGFPKGARAYRHEHPGPGFRYLLFGQLEIKSDDHSTLITPGVPWFEGAHSPVTAICAEDRESRFVRAHLLPEAYLGKPTIRYLNAEDEAKPKLQTHERFCEYLVKLGD